MKVYAVGGWMTGEEVWKPLGLLLPCSMRLEPYDGTASGMDDCLRAMRHDLRPKFLLGWSSGALRILWAAACGRVPEDVIGLFLMAPSARFLKDAGYEGARPASLRAMRHRLIKGDRRGCFSDFFTACRDPDPVSPEWLSRVVEQALRKPVAQAVEGLDYLENVDLRDQVGKVELPVWLLHGREDRIIVPSQSAWLQKRLPRAERILTAGGHCPCRTQWEILAARLRQANTEGASGA